MRGIIAITIINRIHLSIIGPMDDCILGIEFCVIPVVKLDCSDAASVGGLVIAR